MFKLIFVLSILTLSNKSIAAADQVQGVNITKLNTYSDFAVIYFFPAFDNTQECEKTEKFKSIIRFQGGVNREMYASVLAAAMGAKTVDIGINGCDIEGYPLVYRVDVRF